MLRFAVDPWVDEGNASSVLRRQCDVCNDEMAHVRL